MKKSITRRWIINGLGVVLLMMVVFIVTFSFSAQGYIYNGIQQVLIGRSDELLNVFSSSSSGYTTSSEFSSVARAYIENFQDKNSMEIMAISKTGSVLITSTGFAPDQTQAMPDYMDALSDDDGFGYWTGEFNSGEKVMAVTRVVRSPSGTLMGSIRYLVSLEKADRQVSIIVMWLIVIGALIILFAILSGVYFVSSIVSPIRRITSSAKEIAHGDFDVRIEKNADDEIGQLIDTINDMAGELGNAEKMKNDFISSVSHELRTPLTAIKGWAETMQNSGSDSETLEKGMMVISKESQRLSGIVEELLDFSRIQSGRMTLIMNRLDILTQLDEVVFMLTDRARTEGKELIYEDEAVLSPVIGDMNRLKQVFFNVIDNALKYSAEGGVVKISPGEKDGYICVVVKDNGCGIQKEDLPNIKKKFYKANQLVHGSGIGLAVADEIIGMHFGSLEVESEINVGTTVTISIPTEKYLSEHPEIREKARVLAGSPSAVLITEDKDIENEIHSL